MKSLFLLIGLTLGLAPALPVLAQSVLAQSVPIESLRQQEGITISGTVGSVVGNSFVLSDSSGEIIVDAGPRWYQEVNVNAGEQVTVVGEFDEGEFDAYSITRANGEVVTIRSGSGRPPWAGGPNRNR
jgi:hypothetical protein